MNTKELSDICAKIADIQQQIYSVLYYDIRSDEHPCNPQYVACQIAAIINSVGMKTLTGQEITTDEVRTMTEKLEKITEEYNIKKLRPLVARLKELIEDAEG